MAGQFEGRGCGPPCINIGYRVSGPHLCINIGYKYPNVLRYEVSDGKMVSFFFGAQISHV